MNRRDFLLSSAAVVAGACCATTAVAASDQPLCIVRMPGDDFRCWRFVISKGPYKFQVYGEVGDLLDCHGLCATTELAEIIIYEIEVGTVAPFGEPPPPKRVTLSRREKMRVHRLAHQLRGPHECCHRKAV